MQAADDHPFRLTHPDRRLRGSTSTLAGSASSSDVCSSLLAVALANRVARIAWTTGKAGSDSATPKLTSTERPDALNIQSP